MEEDENVSFWSTTNDSASTSLCLLVESVLYFSEAKPCEFVLLIFNTNCFALKFFFLWSDKYEIMVETLLH